VNECKPLVSGRLTLVDCAGSERKEDNMHHSAEQRKETAEINASLYALKECVRMRRLQHQVGRCRLTV
jgi:kinesin family protein 2/24